MLNLKPEDRAVAQSAPLSLVPADPQTAGIDHLDALRSASDEAWRLRNLLSGHQIDTARGRSYAQARAVEICERLDLALDSAEHLMRALRSAGLLRAGGR